MKTIEKLAVDSIVSTALSTSSEAITKLQEITKKLEAVKKEFSAAVVPLMAKGRETLATIHEELSDEASAYAEQQISSKFGIPFKYLQAKPVEPAVKQLNS